MKRIVIDARESGTSTGRYDDKLIEHLAKIAPKEYEFIVLSKPHRLDYLRSIAPNFRVVECNVKEFTFAEQFSLKKQVEDLKPDLVHFTAVQQPVWYRGKVVTTIQDTTTCRFRNPTKNWLVYTVKQSIYKWVNKKVARKSTELLTFTDFVKNDIADFANVSTDKITFAHLAVDPITEPAKPVAGFKGKDYIMYMGRPLPHKNLRRLIEAFALIAPKYPKLLLMIAGKKDASYASYEALAEKLGVADRVKLTDWITDGQLKWAMSNAKIFLWPSLSEGFGLPPLEAMNYGTPVASSNASCIPEVLGGAPHYFDPLDVNDMAEKISEILDNKKLQEDLVARGKKQVKKYSWRRMAEQTLKIYKKALAD